MSKVFDMDASEINDESSPENIERWDSFHGLALVDALEIEYGIQFTISEITDVKNTLDIKRHLKNHGIEIE